MENIYGQWQLGIWRVSCGFTFMQPSYDLPKQIQITYNAHSKEFSVTKDWW